MPLTITLNGNKFTLSDQALESMATTLFRTRKKERGRMLCADDDEITASVEHIGGQGSISHRNCRGKKEAGYFHTHPLGSSDPSWWDAYAILAHSNRHGRPMLGCRGAKADGLIRCETAKRIPTLLELSYLKRKRPKMKFTSALDDPEVFTYLTNSVVFEARKVPELIKPAPPPIPTRIKVEDVVFASSLFKKYTNLDTGESWVERVY